ncbi:MAG: Arginyl-tRNA synthetase [uncultured Frankineae bacterium]|uniref:Arginine--tRNA ligase n=1 Tax=uncultured Frankineae bacterium TaxID=437475 RepID=A0A6J4LXI1_9ACTN|nr:MAG: Arginyl-tRNA synthetase [uncultured Frankineae bacterium]
MTPLELGAAVRAAVAAAVEAGDLAVPVPAEVSVERPRVASHGDYATSVALQLAKPAGRPPREVAELLAARLRSVAGIDSVDVAGPGFLNLRLAQASLGQVAVQVLAQGAGYGRNESAAGQRIDVEFVSANPTGPIHLGGVRWAAVGDALARLLEASGAAVTREYYVNDAGVQIDRFAASLLAAAKGEPVPEEGYAGSYVPAVAARALWRNPGLPAEDEDKVLEVLRSEGTALMLDDIRESLRSFGVDFDVWFSELSLASSGAVERALQRLREQGHVFEQDGAVWLRTTDFGDDKDRVLVKSDGSGTYFLSDAAYYVDKRERGFDVCLYMLGADHHGYVGRLKALAACAGDDPGRNIEILIGQMVNVLKGGEPIRMSKRAGTIVTLEDLVELTGTDAARYTLARSSTDSTLDLDVDLVTRQSSDNPVFYVQYAATRAASVLRNAAEMGIGEPDPAQVDLSLLTSPRETELLLALAEFPQVVASAAELREPHRVARYLEEKVAKAAQRFWDDCQVLPKGDEPVAPTTAPRLLLWRATRTVLENGLGLLGVSAPERM